MNPSDVSKLHWAFACLLPDRPVHAIDRSSDGGTHEAEGRGGEGDATDEEVDAGYAPLLDVIQADIELKLASFSAEELVVTTCALAQLSDRLGLSSSRQSTLLDRLAEAALTWTEKLSGHQLVQLMRSFSFFRHQDSDALAQAVAKLNAQSEARLKELSTNRREIFHAGSCGRWCEVYMERDKSDVGTAGTPDSALSLSLVGEGTARMAKRLLSSLFHASK